MSHYVVANDKNNNLTKTTENEISEKKENEKKENEKKENEEEHHECMICFNIVNEKNSVNCNVCKSGIYHKECLGYWFYTKELENAKKPDYIKEKKMKYTCTICKTIWDENESKSIKYVYKKAHNIYKRHKKKKKNKMTVSELYEKRLELSMKNEINYAPIKQNKKKSTKNIFSFFSCFGRPSRRITPIVSY